MNLTTLPTATRKPYFLQDLSTVLLVLKIFGIYHETEPEQRRSGIRKRFIFWKLYNFLVVLLVWFCFCHFCYRREIKSFPKTSLSEFLKSASLLGWIFHSAVSLSIFFVTWNKRKWLEDICAEWRKMKNSQKGFRLEKKRQLRDVALGLAAALIFRIHFFFFPLSRDPVSNGIDVALKSLEEIAFTYHVVVWILCQVFLACVSRLIVSKVESIQMRSAKLASAEVDVSFQEKAVRCLHKEFHALSKVVEGLDSYFRFYIFASHVFYIPAVCYFVWEMHSILIWDWSSVVAVIKANASFFTLMSICSSAATIPTAIEKMHAAIYDTYLFPKFSARNQLSGFFQRLSGPVIGFTCFDLYVITRKGILNLCSVLLTYFFVLIQFSSTEPGVNVALNCTCC